MVYEEGYKPVIGQPFGVVADTEISPKDEFYNQVGDVLMGKETVDQWIEKTEEVSTSVRDKLIK